MEIKMELWHLITLLIAFFGCIGGFGKVLLDQVEKRQVERAKAQDKASEERARAQDKAREDGQKVLRETMKTHIDEEKKNAAALQMLEKDFLTFKAELPVNYVRREDYVRGQSVIEAKLDALYNKLEVVQIQGAKNA